MAADKGYVIKNEYNGLYWCGLKQWDKQLRKAKIYHSEKYATDAIKQYSRSDTNMLGSILKQVIIKEVD